MCAGGGVFFSHRIAFQLSLASTLLLLLVFILFSQKFSLSDLDQIIENLIATDPLMKRADN